MHQPYDPFNFLPNHGQVGDVSRTPQAGEIISLMTTSLIRYEGYLLGINSEMMTVGMCTVRSFGTENRPCASPIPPQKDTYDYLLFRCDRVMTMSVIQDFTPIAGLNRTTLVSSFDGLRGFNDDATIPPVNPAENNFPPLFTNERPMHEPLYDYSKSFSSATPWMPRVTPQMAQWQGPTRRIQYPHQVNPRTYQSIPRWQPRVSQGPPPRCSYPRGYVMPIPRMEFRGPMMITTPPPEAPNSVNTSSSSSSSYDPSSFENNGKIVPFEANEEPANESLSPTYPQPTFHRVLGLDNPNNVSQSLAVQAQPGMTGRAKFPNASIFSPISKTPPYPPAHFLTPPPQSIEEGPIRGDYNFERAQRMFEELCKYDASREEATADQQITVDQSTQGNMFGVRGINNVGVKPKGYDKRQSFYDAISYDSSEINKLTDTTSTKLNKETFGDRAVRRHYINKRGGHQY